MKKWCAVLFMAISPLAADLIPIQNVTPEIAEAFSQGKLNGSIIELTKGTEIPLELVCTGDLLHFEKSRTPSSIRILQTAYVKKENEQFWFSCDMHEWKPLADFVSGNIKAGMGNYNGELLVKFEAEMNKR